MNDYNTLRDPEKLGDTRWVNRPAYPARKYSERHDVSTQAGRLFNGMQHLIRLRKSTEELAGGRLVAFHTGNAHVLGYIRVGKKHKLLCLANFHDLPQAVDRERFAALPAKAFDVVAASPVDLAADSLELQPHQFAWLRYE